jgi:hypothetical protein
MGCIQQGHPPSPCRVFPAAFPETTAVPFTSAAYLQLLQEANTGPVPRIGDPWPSQLPFQWFGLMPFDIGWLSCALQFPGTLLFNLNTWDAFVGGLRWFEREVWIWTPDFTGSILFLLSGYPALTEAGHVHVSWCPDGLSWWVTFLNLFRCLGFLLGSLLMLPETQVST